LQYDIYANIRISVLGKQPPITTIDNEPTEDESQDNGFSTKDAFILGGAMGWAYEEGRRKRKRKKRKMFSDDSG
jgi:hypothetical protein